MDNGIAQLGITDYLHEVELWQQRLKQWELALPWPDGAAATLCVENLLHVADDLVSLCVLLREQSRETDYVAQGNHLFPREEVETQLGLAIWRIMREEERLSEVLPPGGPPIPEGLPRARLLIESRRT